MPENSVEDLESDICIYYSRSQGAFQAGCMIIAAVILLPIIVIWGCLLVELEPAGKLLLSCHRRWVSRSAGVPHRLGRIPTSEQVSPADPSSR